MRLSTAELGNSAELGDFYIYNSFDYEKNIVILDLNGKIVFEKQHLKNDALVSLPINLKNGIYSIHILNTLTNEKIIKKLFVNR